jgi:hypothetical protein
METKRGRVRVHQFHYYASWLFLRNRKKIMVEGKGGEGVKDEGEVYA